MVTMNRKSYSCFGDVTKNNMQSDDTYNVCNTRDIKSCRSFLAASCKTAASL